MALCVASGTAVARLAIAAFTLAWTHSVEWLPWEEDWRIEGDRLIAVESRVQGSGAGMTVPDGAVLAGGVWRYRPELPPLPELVLANSGAVPDWRLCVAGVCRPLGALVPAAGAVFRLRPC